jgi:opacity protein-like surface antigen
MHIAGAQGISFSYLLPKNGYLSAPISPFSIRGIGIGNVLGVETGFTLYSIPGLAMDGLPFDSNKPLTGPHWSVLVPAQITLSSGCGPVAIKFLGGGFVLWHLSSRINKGNLDRALASYENWDVALSDLELSMKSGFGWMLGTELEFQLNKKLAITTEVQYLSGSSKSSLTGSYSGGTIGGNIETKQANFDRLKSQLEGIEFSLGVKLK